MPCIDVAAKFAEALRCGEVRHYRKCARVDIRPAVPGELVETMLAGERETVNMARAGDYVVRGIQGEQYIIKENTLATRYGPPLTGPDEDGFRKYEAKGDFHAFRYDGEPIEFMAPWGEAMIARSGDYIGTIAIGSNEYYRIEEDAFDTTYTLVTE
jgi:hypothetical protein